MTAHRHSRHYHFIGIGGIGMSAVAEILARRGAKVSGSDQKLSTVTSCLEQLGIQIYQGHAASNIGGADCVVYSTAVRETNPEYVAAKRAGLVLEHRSETLARLMTGSRVVTVTGTHGKTTAAAMIASVLTRGGLDPTVVVGARVPALGGNAVAGKGEWFVAEADESDRSFLRYSPEIAVVTNIDLDHMDVYADLDDLNETFRTHLSRVAPDGCIVSWLDDANLQSIQKKLHTRLVCYSMELQADLSATDVVYQRFCSRYVCLHQGDALGQVKLAVAGNHNVLNSLAAVAVGLELGLSFEVITDALASFTGAERRLQWKGERNGVAVIDDYAHHPTEIEATIRACAGTNRRLLVVFQPHRYSRTQFLMERMGDCFSGAHQVFIIDIYAAGEDAIPEVTSERLAGRLARHSDSVRYVPSRKEVVEKLEEVSRPGDLVLTLGAGDVGGVGEEFLAKER